MIISITLSAQVKKLDKLEQLFDQGMYSKVERKSSKYLTGEFKGNPSPMLFHALSEYYLGDTRRYSKASGILEFEKFLKTDTNKRYQKMYANYINDFHDELINEIIRLKEGGEVKKAEVRYATLQRLFSDNASFNEIVESESAAKVENNQPDNTTTTNESIPSENATKSESKSDKKLREHIVEEAKKHIGTPYKYGGTTTKGFDCSGYTQYVMAKNNVSIPRTSTAQATSYKKIKTSEAKPGDLVFFGSSKNKISHVGIVTSQPGQELTMIHASTSRGVMISIVKNDPYWSARLLYVVRVIEDK